MRLSERLAMAGSYLCTIALGALLCWPEAWSW